MALSPVSSSQVSMKNKQNKTQHHHIRHFREEVKNWMSLDIELPSDPKETLAPPAQGWGTFQDDGGVWEACITQCACFLAAVIGRDQAQGLLLQNYKVAGSYL